MQISHAGKNEPRMLTDGATPQPGSTGRRATASRPTGNPRVGGGVVVRASSMGIPWTGRRPDVAQAPYRGADVLARGQGGHQVRGFRRGSADRAIGCAEVSADLPTVAGGRHDAACYRGAFSPPRGRHGN